MKQMAKLDNEEPMLPAGPSNWKGKALGLLGVAVIIAAGAFAGMQYTKAQKLNKQLADIKSNPNKVAEDQTKELIAKIGQLIILPEGEQPTVATVSDLKPLADQPFFAHAKVGFKVLIYTNAKKAILYDPTANKIVEVAPVNIGDSAAAPQVAGQSTTKKPVTPAPANDNTDE